MTIRRILALSGVLPMMITLAIALPGCGGGGEAETNPDGSPQVAPVTNPAPGVVPLDQEYGPQTPAKKGR